MSVSIVIPAHNEEKFLPRCLDSAEAAIKLSPEPVEIIVVCNRCTDRTEAIARMRGCTVVTDESRNLARIRNRGVSAATGDIILTIDADSWMVPGVIAEAISRLRSGRYVGGGTLVRPERISIGIVCSLFVLVPRMVARSIFYGGLFWCFKRDFAAIGGFDESLISVEDADFAVRLKKFGKKTGRTYGSLGRNYIWTSCRKFDQFGDWVLVRNPRLVAAIFSGRDQKAADLFYYDARDDTRHQDPNQTL
jgi:glycosyltransferase involved in cell wall biosynthesis